jgi:hypothetical protein
MKVLTGVAVCLIDSVALLASCGGPARSAEDGQARSAPSETTREGSPSVVIVDSVEWDSDISGGVLYRIAVRHGSYADTLPVLTSTIPRLTGNRIGGISYDRDAIPVGGFLYTVAERKFSRLPLPANSLEPFAFDPNYTILALSESASRMKTIQRRPGQSLEVELVEWPTEAPTVIEWPTAARLYHGPPVERYESDVTYSSVEWRDSTFVFLNRLLTDSPKDFRYQRTIFNVRTRKAVVDTVRRDH